MAPRRYSETYETSRLQESRSPFREPERDEAFLRSSRNECGVSDTFSSHVLNNMLLKGIYHYRTDLLIFSRAYSQIADFRCQLVG